jgi:GntR family transcriptional repressor for pyruvate dehydrogenase complex
VPERTYESVIQFIKREILCGRLQPGQKLPPERNLAESLMVGRNSVREALRTLEILGVIESAQGAGNFVSCNFKKSLVESMSMMFAMQKTDYRQISELRQALESQAIVLAADRITPAQVERLSKIFDGMTAGRDGRYGVTYDQKFHSMLAEASGNTLIIEILKALSAVVNTFISDLRRKILADGESRNRLQLSHQRMLESLKAKDGRGAYAAMAEHYEIVNQHIGDFSGK